METTIRKKAMIWWNTLSLEEQFYETINANHLITGDKTRHPNTLTGSEIQLIYSNKFFEIEEHCPKCGDTMPDGKTCDNLMCY
jgi:hypothetical protein